MSLCLENVRCAVPPWLEMADEGEGRRELTVLGLVGFRCIFLDRVGMEIDGRFESQQRE